MTLKVKTDMPDENQQPITQTSQPDSLDIAPQVIQPTNSNMVTPYSSSPEHQPVASQSITQPADVLNGQPSTSTTPISSIQLEQTSAQKSWAWLYIFIALGVIFPIAALVFLVYMMIKKQWDRFFIALGILQALGIVLIILVMLLAVQLANNGASGTEFIALFLFVTVVPMLSIISLINLIGLPIYMRKYKPQGKGRSLCITSLVISALIFMYGLYSVFGLILYTE